MNHIDPKNNPARSRVDASGNQAIGHGSQATLNITAATIVDTGVGRVARISVVAAGSTAGAVYDSNSTAGNTAANQIAVIPANQAAGSIITIDFPYSSGLVVVPGTGGNLGVSFTP